MADKERKEHSSRRAVLKGAALLAGLAAVPLFDAGAAIAGQVRREGSVPKSAMKYQSHPHGKEDCTGCMHFIPGKTPSAMGECTVLAGPISPHGWCLAFTAKS